MKSLGFVEVTGVVAAIDALDIMCKSANVSLVSWERKLGGRLVTLIITGDVSAVSSAIENAKAHCIKKPCASAVIANPHSETKRLAELSAKRLEKKSSEGGQRSEPQDTTPVKTESVPLSLPQEKKANEAPKTEAKKATKKTTTKKTKTDEEGDNEQWHLKHSEW